MTESFLDCGKAVLLIVGLLGPHRSQTSPLFKEKCRRNRKLQGRADRRSLLQANWLFRETLWRPCASRGCHRTRTVR